MNYFNKYLKYKNIYLNTVNLNGDHERKRTGRELKSEPITPVKNLLRIQKWYWSQPHTMRDYSVHILAGRDYNNILNRVNREKLVKVNTSGKYSVAKYMDNCTKWNLDTMISRGLIFNTEKKTFSFPLVKFFSFDQLRIKPSGRYRRYKKYDGTAIYIWDGMISTLGSSKSSQVKLVTNLLMPNENDDLGFPLGWTIFGEYVDGILDEKVERISGPAKFYITYGYNHKGQGFFPEEIREQNIITNPNVNYALGEELSSDQIMKELNDMDDKALSSKNISDIKEGMVLWQDGIPYKLKSKLYMGISKINRPKNFLKKYNNISRAKVELIKVINIRFRSSENIDAVKEILINEFNDEVKKIQEEAKKSYQEIVALIKEAVIELNEKQKSLKINIIRDLMKYVNILSNGGILKTELPKHLKKIGNIKIEALDKELTYKHFMEKQQ